ncbi:hypothetical protein G6F68_011817 [Rhizopus microsporus]|nr:hypothetical protein G6F68_011817 [Rhizopus microsporus]
MAERLPVHQVARMPDRQAGIGIERRQREVVVVAVLEHRRIRAVTGQYRVQESAIAPVGLALVFQPPRPRRRYRRGIGGRHRQRRHQQSEQGGGGDDTQRVHGGLLRSQPRSAAGNHSDRAGKKVTTSSTPSAANQNGQMVRMLWPTLILPMEVPMNSTDPTGGVTRPRPPVSTSTRPNTSRPRKNSSTVAYSMAGRTIGRLTDTITRSGEAPVTRAASSTSEPMLRRADEMYR